MTRILVTDDENKIREMIRKYGEYEGYEVDEASDGLEAVACCQRTDYDLVIMDIMMPNLDGFLACRKIREYRPDLPFIMLSALGEEYDKIHGFELGIDDYVVKPFSPKELMMRVRAVLKRVKTGAGQDVFRSGRLTVDYGAHTASVDTERLKLSPKEYDLLAYLTQNAGIALTREQILRHVWNYDYVSDDRTLDTHIKLLRKNLGPCSDRIVTVRGVGYRFEK